MRIQSRPGTREERWGLPAVLLAAAFFFCLAATATAQDDWRAGEMLTALPAGAPTTGTMSLELGGPPLAYRLEAIPAQMRLEFFQPDLVRQVPLAPTSITRGRNTFEAEGVTIDAVASSPDAVYYDIRAGSDLEGLIILNVSTDDRDTTSTIDPLTTSVILERGGEEVHFHMVAGQVTRVRTAEGFRIVAPLRQGQHARLAVSTRPYSSSEIREWE